MSNDSNEICYLCVSGTTAVAADERSQHHLGQRHLQVGAKVRAHPGRLGWRSHLRFGCLFFIPRTKVSFVKDFIASHTLK